LSQENVPGGNYFCCTNQHVYLYQNGRQFRLHYVGDLTDTSDGSRHVDVYVKGLGQNMNFGAVP